MKEPDFSMDDVDAELKKTAQRMLEEYERLKKLEPCDYRCDPGASTRELAIEWGETPANARKKIKKLREAGKIIKGIRYERKSDNTWGRVPVYRFTEDKDEQ